MKTIKQLNKKWWYRLIKVIFVLLIIFAIVTVFVAAFSEEYPETNKELDRKNTTITCLNGNEKTFSLKKANSFSDINLTGSHFNTYKNSDGETVDDFPLEAAEKLCDLEGVHSGFTLKPVNCDKSNLLPGTSCPGSGNTDSVPYPEYS